MGGKSPDAFRTISEVAEWLDRPAHVLRFWESKFTQIKPVKRAGGRRYYRPQDMLLLGGIKKLLHDEGMTIKGVQKVLREQGVKHVADMSDPLEDALAASSLGHDDSGGDTIDVPAQAPDSARVLAFPGDGAGRGGTRPRPDTGPAADTGADAPAPAKPAQDTPPAAPAAEQKDGTPADDADTPDLFSAGGDQPATPETGPAEDGGAHGQETPDEEEKAAPHDGASAAATGPGQDSPEAATAPDHAADDTPAAQEAADAAPDAAADTPGDAAPAVTDGAGDTAPDTTTTPPADRPDDAPATPDSPEEAPALLARIASLDAPVPPRNSARVRALLDQLVAVHDHGADARDG